MIPISQSANKRNDDNTGVAVFVERNEKTIVHNALQRSVTITYGRRDVTLKKNREKN